MNRVNLYDTYLMGKSFRLLEQIQAGVVPANIVSDLMGLQSWLRYLTNNTLLSPGKAHEHATILHSAVSYMLTEWLNEPLSEERAIIIKSVFDMLEATLSSEFAKLHTYYIPSVGTFSTDALVNQPEKMFFESANLIPDETLIEIREVGKCLAVSLPTAAGFHLMRAVESLLRHYYEVLSKGASRPARGAMGTYLDAILQLPGGDKELHAALKQIKTFYRDPIAQPTVVLTGPEAISLLGVVQRAINRTLTLIKSTVS
jgi:hypothetical protein